MNSDASRRTAARRTIFDKANDLSYSWPGPGPWPATVRVSINHTSDQETTGQLLRTNLDVCGCRAALKSENFEHAVGLLFTALNSYTRASSMYLNLILES